MTAVPRLTVYPARHASVARLGYNVVGTFTDLASLDVAKAGGASIVRAQAAWSDVEDYTTAGLTLPAGFPEALAHCAAIGLQPMLVAAYGPPWADIGTLTVSSETAAGAHVIPVTGDLAGIVTPTDHVATANPFEPCGESYWAYYGCLIDSVNVVGGTVTLAAATTIDLHVGDELTVNRLSYAALPDTNPANAGVTAYLRYAKFLADQIAAAGCTGYVNLWNEMPWQHSRWDARYAMYDDPVAHGFPEDDTHQNNRGLAILTAAVEVGDLPAGVVFTSGMSDKTAGSGLKAQGLTPSAMLKTEGIHPYGNYAFGSNPEEYAWDPSRLETQGPFAGQNAYGTVNIVSNAPSSFGLLGWADAQDPVMDIMATECGTAELDDEKDARFLLRRVASLWGMGVPPVLYSLADSFDYGYAVTDPTNSYAPRPAYTALQRLMGLVAALGDPGSGGTLMVPTLVGSPWEKPWPPMITSLYGAAGGLVLVWQRTWAKPGDQWPDIPSPPERTLRLSLPGPIRVAEAINVRTGADAGVTRASTTISVPVSDDVIAIRTAQR